MGVKTFSQEVESSVSPARMYKALVLDTHTLFPKIMPEAIKSIEFVQGDGVAVGNIKQTNLTEAVGGYNYVKHKIEAVDVDSFYYKYTNIEGDMHGENVDFIVTELKVEPKGPGCVVKMTNHFHSKNGEPKLEEAKIEVGKERVSQLFKVVEEYLQANPSVCA